MFYFFQCLNDQAIALLDKFLAVCTMSNKSFEPYKFFLVGIKQKCLTGILQRRDTILIFIISIGSLSQ